jgi:hypothetical protein
MANSNNEIECFVDTALEDALFEIFKNEFHSFKEIEHALEYLKEKVQNLEAEDFEDSVI